ncbi:MAG: DUF2459 domain-containing protein [Acetobacteraceae bacterium]
MGRCARGTVSKPRPGPGHRAEYNVAARCHPARFAPEFRYAGCLYYAATVAYGAFETCNTWIAEALRAGGDQGGAKQDFHGASSTGSSVVHFGTSRTISVV